MNDYRITGGSGDVIITAIDEKDARRIYRQTHTEGETRRITAIAFVRENVPATKQQEREALEKIKALVAELGPQSYLATAFDGAFEDAETNIENDFAFSMKARFEDAEKRLREMGSVYNAAKMDAVHLQEQLTAAQEQLAEAQEEAEALRGKQLPVWLHSAVYSLAVTEIADARKQMEQSAETMAHFADSPQDIAFAAAVKSYRAAKERRGSCEQIVAGLETLTEKGGAA